MKEYPALTVELLKKFCEEQIKAGNGKKKILISGDDEGNYYHGLFYEFQSNLDDIKIYNDYGMFHDNVDPETVILLG